MRELHEYKDKEGRNIVSLAKSTKLEDELCDFCARKNPPYKIYKCKDFPYPGAPWHWSLGDWNACSICADLIDKNDREGLAVRSAASFALEEGSYPIERTRRFHEEFFKNRKE